MQKIRSDRRKVDLSPFVVLLACFACCVAWVMIDDAAVGNSRWGHGDCENGSGEGRVPIINRYRLFIIRITFPP